MDVQALTMSAAAYAHVRFNNDQTAGIDFAQTVREAEQTDADRTQAYVDHLRQKYGAHFRVEYSP